jgi:hypothetical protein
MAAHAALIIAAISLILMGFSWVAFARYDSHGLIGIGMFMFTWAIGVTFCLGV